MLLIPYYSYERVKVPDRNEIEHVLGIVAQVKEISASGKVNSNIYYEMFGVNNFELLTKIENVFLNGFGNIEDYHLLLNHYPLDGEGSHVIEYFYMNLWGYMNQGETEVEKIFTFQ